MFHQRKGTRRRPPVFYLILTVPDPSRPAGVILTDPARYKQYRSEGYIGVSKRRFQETAC